MISSRIDEILIQQNLNNNNANNNSNSKFINSLSDTSNALHRENNTRTKDFNYENIKGITLEEIDTIFLKDEDKQMAKNLRLATLFTEDKYLGQALFNTVLGQPFTMGYNFLYETYEDKHTYFKSEFSNGRLNDLLHESVSNRTYNSLEKGEKIPQEYLDEVLLEVNSFNFLSALSNTTKDQYGRYKDEKDDYSFLYNDYYLKYQELIYKYEEQKELEQSLIKQF